MPKTKKQKEELVESLTTKANNAQALFILSTNAINPNEASDLKIKLGELGAEYHIVKNSLFKIASKKAGLPETTQTDTGQNAIVFAGNNSPEVAKLLQKFIKESQKAKFKGGYLEQKEISATDIDQLASLPSKEQMIAQVLATMNSPVTGFVQVLAANIRGLITVVDAYQQKKSI